MKPATILIIEDHASVRTLLARGLEAAGYHVYEAANSRQGLDRCHARPVDLVITDLEMPEMNGLDVIQELTPSFRHVKIIAISGCSIGELQKAKLLGARRTFQKPMYLYELLHAIEEELQH